MDLPHVYIERFSIECRNLAAIYLKFDSSAPCGTHGCTEMFNDDS